MAIYRGGGRARINGAGQEAFVHGYKESLGPAPTYWARIMTAYTYHLIVHRETGFERMKKDNDEQAPAVSFSSPLAEHESVRKTDDSTKKTDGSSSMEILGPAHADSIEAGGIGPANAENPPREKMMQQDHPSAQEIDNIHTYVQGKSASILENAMSKLISDLKNKRFENKKTPRK